MGGGGLERGEGLRSDQTQTQREVRALLEEPVFVWQPFSGCSKSRNFFSLSHNYQQIHRLISREYQALKNACLLIDL